MGRKIFGLLPLLTLLLTFWGMAQLGYGSQASMSNPGGDPAVRHCSIITVSQGNRVFFGGNDDYFNRDSTYWVDIGDASGYGAIYFGRPDNIQQGFNEKGLAYDANGLASAPVTSHSGRKPVSGGYTSYPIQILQECGTVEEVIAWVREHRWHDVMHDQLHFADATGDAVVISAGPAGKVAFTRKPAGDGFLVSTNFNRANPSTGGYPCWRYRRAGEMLSEIQSQDELTAERVASIMEAVHVESPSSWTLYSLVADLRKRLVYVYFMFQYDVPIILSIDEEIARPPPVRPLSELFPEETQQRADQAYERLAARPARCDLAGLVWLGTVGLSLAALLLLARTRGRSLAFWLPVVAVLGPAGLLGRLIASTGRRPHALVETVGDLVPCVAGTVAVLLPLVLVPAIGQTGGLLLLALYGLPLTVGLFLYQAPMLAWATKRGYARTALRRLPAVLVSTNLALAGLLAIGLPLMDRHANYCGISRLAALQWWPIAVLGAVVGGLLVYVYHAWAVRRGFTAWSALLWGTAGAGDDTTTVCSPSWNRLWLWVVLSYGVLVAGMVMGVMGMSLA